MAIQKKRKNDNDEKLEFDDPYEGFAMLATITIDDAGVEKLHGTPVLAALLRGRKLLHEMRNRALLHHSCARHRFGSHKHPPGPQKVAQKCPKALPGGSLGTPRAGSGCSQDLCSTDLARLLEHAALSRDVSVALRRDLAHQKDSTS